MRINRAFTMLSSRIARAVGTPLAFVLALASVVLWALTGPRFHYSETWQLVINTGTTIVTFLMVFLIQNAQNRDADSVQIKLDELLRAISTANDKVINIERLDEASLRALRQRYEREASEGVSIDVDVNVTPKAAAKPG